VNYWLLLLARAFTGVGEASFLCIAPPFIDKAAPPNKKSVHYDIITPPICSNANK
jgi:predicted MFS family arabinose efflux permease